MSFLVPRNDAAPSFRIKASSNRVIAASVRDGEFEDIAVVAMEDGEMHLLDCVMRGEFFWMRMQQGRLCRVLAVNAHSFSYAGETVFQHEDPAAWVQAHFCEDGMVIERAEHEGEVYVRDLRDRQFQR